MYQLNPALLNTDQILSESKNINNTKKPTNKTFKNKKHVKFDSTHENIKPKLTNINSLLHSSNESDDGDSDNDFRMQYTSLLNDDNISNNLNNINNQDLIEAEKRKMDKFNIKNNLSNLENINYSNLNDSYKSNINYLNNNNQSVNTMDLQHHNESKTIESNNKLLSKLDYIIHLLEEQHNEKTNHITEELILYLFLGIFMIYVLDSFTKASKYIR